MQSSYLRVVSTLAMQDNPNNPKTKYYQVGVSLGSRGNKSALFKRRSNRHTTRWDELPMVM
jgi:hypothetical protein